MTIRLLALASLVALFSSGCAVRTGAYVGAAAPVGYYGGPDVYVAPYAVPAWREPVVVGYPRYYAPRPYVRVAPRYYYPARHYAYRGTRRGRW